MVGRAESPLTPPERETAMDRIANIMGAIVTVALVTTIVSRPNSAKVIKAFGDAFSDSISASLGK